MALPRHEDSDEGRRSVEGPSASLLEDAREEGGNSIEQSASKPAGADGANRGQDAFNSYHRSSEESLESSTYADSQEMPEKPQAIHQRFWQQYKGVVLMILAQFFNTVMAAIARLMETLDSDLPPMSPFQMIFARQSITVVLSLAYMWWHRVADAPLGAREVRPWLVARGLSGFFGLFGLYTSLETLPLSDAVVLTFLAPMLASYLSAYFVDTPFSRRQQVAGFVSIVGVVLITRPVSLLTAVTGGGGADPAAPAMPSNGTSPDGATVADTNSSPGSDAPLSANVHPVSRAIAVCFSLLGVLGTSCTFFTISHIGQRAHPLISVNYFSSFCTIISAVCLLFIPAVPFRLPASALEWFLLVLLGASGFTMQFLLTASLAHRKSTLVLNLVYVQMLFALGFDKILWGETPGWMSWVGGGMILASVVWVAVGKQADEKKEEGKVGDEERGNTVQQEEGGHEEERRGFIAGMEDRDEGDLGEQDAQEGASERRSRDGSGGKI